jgi:error-prone DNA polymerase
VAYQTLYLKLYHPVALTCALLNHQPMGFYRPDVVIGDAQRHGVTVLRPDVNLSQDACTLEARDRTCDRMWSVRLGLRYVHGLGEAGRERIVARRGDRPFRDLRDFCRRTRLSKPVTENLIRAGAMESLGRTRRDLLWELGGLKHLGEGLDLAVPITPADLPDLGRLERLLWEYELLGLAPDDHVMGLYRDRLRAQGVSSSGELASKQPGERVWVAGQVIVRQRPPTAKGHVFFTLEDEEGLINLIVRPQVYERYREAMRNAPLLLVEGVWQREGQGSVLVYQAAKLSRF